MAAESTSEPVLRKLEELRARYEALAEDMNRPEVASDPHRIVALNKEHGKLRRTIEPYESYRQACSAIAESEAMLTDPACDPDMKALAKEELESARTRAHDLMEMMKAALVTSEDAAINSVILEIRAGTGGEEAALFAGNLRDMYERYCDRHRFTVEIMDASPSDLGGFKEVILNVKGEGVYQCLGYEGGGHRVQRVPITEAQGRVHTSAATVAVLPEPENIEIQIDWDKDVVEYVSRAGGPGGQNVNKVSSAIRLEHLATGITVSMREEKSQHKNRAKARRLMTTRLYDHMMHAQQSHRDANRRNMIGSGDRSERIRTYNFPQNRCTDHRINMDLYCLDRVMDGELDELISALQKHDLELRLKNL
jgi:peptide chain release factor 1